MATLTSTSNIDIKQLGDYIKADLPSYAKPLFIRLVSEFEHTGTYKAQKMKLVEEGFNVNTIKDKVYYFNIQDKNYNELTVEIYKDILNGNVRFWNIFGI